MIGLLINHWRFFKQYGDNTEALLPIAYVHYIYLRMKYGWGFVNILTISSGIHL